MSGQRQTSRLLINEAPLQVLPSLAAAIGLNEAIVLQQIHFLVSTHHALVAENYRWICRTMDDWAKEFVWWNVKTVKRVFSSLRKRNLIVTGKFNENKWDHTLWYRIDYEALEALSPSVIVPVDKDKLSLSEEDKVSQSDSANLSQSSLLENRESKDSLEPVVPDAPLPKVEDKPKAARKPNPIYDWVALNIFKVTPESGELDKDIDGWIGANTAKLINAEKARLGIPKTKPLTDEQRATLAAQLPGLLKYYGEQSPGLSLPQKKGAFGLLVTHWYEAGKPYSVLSLAPKFVPVERDDYVSPSEVA